MILNFEVELKRWIIFDGILFLHYKIWLITTAACRLQWCHYFWQSYPQFLSFLWCLCHVWCTLKVSSTDGSNCELLDNLKRRNQYNSQSNFKYSIQWKKIIHPIECSRFLLNIELDFFFMYHPIQFQIFNSGRRKNHPIERSHLLLNIHFDF